MEKELKEKLEKQTKDRIEQVLEQGISSNNIDILDKLVDIYKDTKEVESMYGNYGNYGNYGRPGYDSYGRDNYGEYGNYVRRGRDSKYRGYEHLGNMEYNYGRYMEGRERYGHDEDTKKSLRYMLESMEDFARMLKEDAQSQEEVQMIRETAQRIAQM